MHIAGTWSLPLILVCENNGWEMATPWQKVRKHRELIPYAEPFGFATRKVDGNDPWDVYHSARWARATALSGQAVFLIALLFVAVLTVPILARPGPKSRKIWLSGRSVIR